MARTRRIVVRVALADGIYRLALREPLRKHLGIERTHERFIVQALGKASLYPDKCLETRSRWRASRRERRLSKEGFDHKTLALPSRASRA